MHKGHFKKEAVHFLLEENQKPKKCTHIHIAFHGSKWHFYKGPGQADILSSVEGVCTNKPLFFSTLHPSAEWLVMCNVFTSLFSGKSSNKKIIFNTIKCYTLGIIFMSICFSSKITVGYSNEISQLLLLPI